MSSGDTQSDLPKQFHVRTTERLSGFVVGAAVLAPLAPVLFQLGLPRWLAAILTVGILVGVLRWSIHTYRSRSRWSVIVRSDSFQVTDGKGTNTVPFSAVRYAFWSVDQRKLDTHILRLVMEDGLSVTLGGLWAESPALARRLLAELEAYRKTSLDARHDLDFGDVKLKAGVLTVGDKSMPPRTRCEVSPTWNNIRFDLPDGRTVNVPLQWVSHPRLVEELVNGGTEAAE